MKKSILLSLLFLPFCVLANPTPTPDTQNAGMRPLLVTAQNLKLIPVSIQQKNARDGVSLDIRYPRILGAPMNSAAAHFNQLVQAAVDKQVAAFQKSLTDTGVNNNAPYKLPDAANYLNANYNVTGFRSKSQQTEFISVRFIFNSFVRGMAHPATEILSINYDLGHDKPLALADLFKPDSNYLTVIADNVMQQLQTKKMPAAMIKTGAAATAENYKNWNLSFDGLLITFNEAQVAPRFFGKVEVNVPRGVLENIVNHSAACTLSIINCDGT